jgi:hypothetical protein
MFEEREEPEPCERKLDILPPTLAEIDQRIADGIAAEHKFMCDIVAEVLAEVQRGWEVGAMGPPGPSGPPGEQGPPGKLPLVNLWVPETVARCRHHDRRIIGRSVSCGLRRRF